MHHAKHAQVYALRSAIIDFPSYKKGILSRMGFSIVYKTAVGHFVSHSGAERGKCNWDDRPGMWFKYRTPSEYVCKQAAVHWLACLQ